MLQWGLEFFLLFLQTLAPPAPLADLSNLRDQLQFGLAAAGMPGSLPLGPFAFGAPQQLQPGHGHPVAGLAPGMAGPAAASVGPVIGPRGRPLPNGRIISPFALARTPAALNLRLNPSAPIFDPATLAAAAATAAPVRGGRLSDPQRQHRAWDTVDSDEGAFSYCGRSRNIWTIDPTKCSHGERGSRILCC